MLVLRRWLRFARCPAADLTRLADRLCVNVRDISCTPFRTFVFGVLSFDAFKLPPGITTYAWLVNCGVKVRQVLLFSRCQSLLDMYAYFRENCLYFVWNTFFAGNLGFHESPNICMKRPNMWWKKKKLFSKWAGRGSHKGTYAIVTDISLKNKSGRTHKTFIEFSLNQLVDGTNVMQKSRKKNAPCRLTLGQQEIPLCRAT